MSTESFVALAVIPPLLAAIALSFIYGRLRAAGVVVVAGMLIAIGIALFVRLASHEIPLWVDIAVVISMGAAIATAVLLTGARGRGFIARAVWGFLFGLFAYVTTVIVTYVGLVRFT
jgi:hypothetical protein